MRYIICVGRRGATYRRPALSFTIRPTMANFQPLYIPSRSKGMVWKVYFHKPKGALAYVAAAEGTLRDGFFTHRLYADRTIRVNMPGRATGKAVADAGQELLKQMADNSYITADCASDFTGRLVMGIR